MNHVDQSQLEILDSLSDSILVADREGLVVALNQAARLIFHLPAADQIGRPLERLLPAVPPLIDRAREDGQAQGEITLGDGTEQRRFDARISPWRAPDGMWQGWLIALRDVTEVWRAEEELRAQKQLLESLVRVARATAEQPTVEETLQNSLDVSTALTQAEYGSLFLLDKSGALTNSIIARSRVDAAQKRRLVRQVLDKGLAGWVVQHRRPGVVHDTTLDERWISVRGGMTGMRSALSVPILSGDDLLGILTLMHREPHHFSDEHVYLMQAAADQMALAVRNAALFDEQRLLADRQATLFEVLRRVGSHLEPEAVTQAAVESVADLTGWPAVCILLPGDTVSNLRVQAAAGLVADQAGNRVSAAGSVARQVVQQGEALYIADSSTNPDHRPWYPATASQLAVPLQRANRMLGVFEVLSDQPHAFDREDLTLATSMADAIALALDNARFYTAMRKHAGDLNTLYTINRMIGRSLLLEEMLAKALYSALTSLGFGFGLIALVDSTTEELVMAAERGLPPAMSEQTPFSEYVLARNEAVVIDDIDEAESPEVARLLQESPPIVSQFRELDIRSCVGVPLIHQRQILGTLCMFSRHPRVSRPEDVTLQMTIGQQIAMAVSNSRLFRTIADERSLLQALISSSRDGIVMLSAHQRILVANQRALDFLNLPGRAEDWVNQPVGRALLLMRHQAPAIIRLAVKEMRRVIDGHDWLREGEFSLPPRTIAWINLPVMAGVATLGRLIVLRDVTEERLLDQVREDLLHTMVHDLRNPLTNIFGSLDFLRDDLAAALSVEQAQILEIALAGTKQMIRLVSAILDISRLESGRMPLDQGPISVPALLNQVLLNQMPLAESSDLTLVNLVSSNLPLAWADAALYERVFQNLVGNAVKFTPPGGRITVDAYLEKSRRPQLVVLVQDTGPGVPPEHQERIFDKFTTSRHKASGSGLGLAFCKMVAEAHGARIWVECPPDQGATFFVTMPTLAAAGSQQL
jgi:signal transduction histidine kinase/putative methionine-R-sulfoxide reductase with GAF domain